MEPIEIIKLILNKSIYRTHIRTPPYQFTCIHTEEAASNLVDRFPCLDYEKVMKIISQEIHIRNGKLTDFVGGRTSCARIINRMI